MISDSKALSLSCTAPPPRLHAWDGDDFSFSEIELLKTLVLEVMMGQYDF